MLTNISKTIEPFVEDFNAEPSERKMLTDWSDTKTAAFQKKIMSFGHDLAATGLFTDAALIALLERHPWEKMDICTTVSYTHLTLPTKA